MLVVSRVQGSEVEAEASPEEEPRLHLPLDRAEDEAEDTHHQMRTPYLSASPVHLLVC